MAPITWRNVNAPDLRASQLGLAAAGDAFQNAVRGIGDLAKSQRDINIGLANEAASNAQQQLIENIFAGTQDQKAYDAFDFNTTTNAIEGLTAAGRKAGLDFLLSRENELDAEALQNLNLLKGQAQIEQAKAGAEANRASAQAARARARAFDQDRLEKEADNNMINAANKYLTSGMTQNTSTSELMTGLNDWMIANNATAAQRQKILAMAKGEMAYYDTPTGREDLQYLNQQQQALNAEYAPQIAPLDYGIQEADKIINRRTEIQKPIDEAKSLVSASAYVNNNVDATNWGDDPKDIMNAYDKAKTDVAKDIKEALGRQLAKEGKPKAVIDKYTVGYTVPEELANLVLQSMPKDQFTKWHGKTIATDAMKDIMFTKAMELALANIEADAAEATKSTLEGQKTGLMNEIGAKMDKFQTDLRGTRFAKKNLLGTK